MTESIPNPTPKQMAFTVTLPDPITQYQKCPVMKTVTRTTQTTVETIVTDESGNTISDNMIAPDPVVSTYKIQATIPGTPYTQTNPDGSIATITPQVPVTWDQIVAAAKVVLPLIASQGQSALAAPLSTGAALIAGNASTEAPALSPADTALKTAVSSSPVTADLINNIFPDPTVDPQAYAVAQGTWGLGCPAGCGHFWQFANEDIVSQILTCPRCGAKVTLVAPSS
jgi:hypothetical protein